MEPEWMRSIPSKTICDVYYWLFVFYSVLAGIIIVSAVVVMFGTSIPKSMMLPIGFQTVVSAAILVALSLFMYIMCDRALLDKPTKEGYAGMYRKMSPDG
jgi:hypothetical protein